MVDNKDDNNNNDNNINNNINSSSNSNRCSFKLVGLLTLLVVKFSKMTAPGAGFYFTLRIKCSYCYRFFSI